MKFSAAHFTIFGAGERENWVLDNFAADPLTGQAMVATAENVARKYQISREQQHAVKLRRHAQYQAALADDRAFEKRYMTLPFDVPEMPMYMVWHARRHSDPVHRWLRDELLAVVDPVLAAAGD